MPVQNVTTPVNVNPQAVQQRNKAPIGQTIASGAFVGAATATSGYFFLPNAMTGSDAMTLSADKFTKAVAKVGAEKQEHVEELKDIREYAKECDGIIDKEMNELLENANEISKDDFIKKYTGEEFASEAEYNTFIEKTKTETTKLQENFDSAKKALEDEAKMQNEIKTKFNNITERTAPTRPEDLKASQAYPSKAFAAYEESKVPKIKLFSSSIERNSIKLSQEITEKLFSPEIKLQEAMQELHNNKSALAEHELISKIFNSAKNGMISKDSLKNAFVESNLGYLKEEAGKVLADMGKDVPRIKSFKKAAIVGAAVGAVYTAIMAIFSGRSKKAKP